MPYIFLFFSVFSNAVKGYGSKRVSDYTETVTDSALINIMRNILCCIISIFIISNKNSLFFSSPAELIICIISGVSMSVFMISWNFAVKNCAYMLVSACSTGSFIIPCLAGILIFGEKLTPWNIVSFIIICIAIFFLIRYNCRIKKKLTSKQLVLLSLILISQGINQTSQKLFIHYTSSEIGIYTFYTFIMTTISLYIIKLLTSGKEKLPGRSKIIHFIPYIIIMSVGLFGASYFQTVAAKSIDSIILYPLISAASLCAGVLMSRIFFKEKITRDNTIGIILVFIALILSRI